MNLEIIAVNLAVVSIIFIPLFLLIYLGQSEYRKVDKQFKTEAKKFGLNITLKDRWNQNSIGIDIHQQKLLFVQKRNHECFVDLIDLNSITRCDFTQESDLIKINGEKEQVLQKIILELFNAQGVKKFSINLFDSENTIDQEYEVKHAEDWKQIINKNLTPSFNRSMVA